MRTSVLFFAVILGCSQSGQQVPPPPPDPVPNPDPDPDPDPDPPELHVAPAYFVAEASLDALRVQGLDDEDAVRISPTRGRGFGRGSGTVTFVGLDPSKTRAVLAFDATNASRPDALFAVRLDGADADQPTLLVDDVGPPVAAAIDDERVAFVSGSTIGIARLDGTQSEVLATLEGGAARAQVAFAGDVLAVFVEGPEPSVRFVPLVDGVEPSGPFTVVASDGLERGLPDGSVLLRGAMPTLLGRDGIATIFDEGTRVLGYAETTNRLVFSQTSTSGVRVSILRLGEADPVLETRAELPGRRFTEPAMAMSRDGRWVYVFETTRNDTSFAWRVPIDGEERGPREDVGALDRSTESVVAEVSDAGAFVVVEGNRRAYRFASGEAPRTLNIPGLGGAFVGLMGERMVFEATRDVTIVPLDGTSSQRLTNLSATALLDDAILELAPAGESALYWMDQRARVEQLVDWTPGRFEDVRVLDDLLLVRRSTFRWAVADKITPTTLRPIAVADDETLAGVTADHLVITGNGRVALYPLDGSSPTTPTRTVAEPSSDRRCFDVQADDLFWCSATEVFATPQAEPDTARTLHTVPGTISIIAYDAEQRAVVVAWFEGGRLTIDRVDLEGSVITLVDAARIAGAPTKIEFAPGGRYATIRFDEALTARETWAFTRDAASPPVVVTESSAELWGFGETSAFFGRGTRALFADEFGISVADFTREGLRQIWPRPLTHFGDQFLSPDEDLVLGRDGDALVLAPVDGGATGQTIDDVVDAAFLPDGRVVYASIRDGADRPTLRILTPGGDDAVLYDGALGVHEIVRAEENAVLFQSWSGGDRAIYALPIEGGDPIALTPVDDADERRAERLVR